MQVLKTETLNSLYENTDARINELNSFRQLLISIKCFEDFNIYKLKFTQLLFDIEDDFRDSLQNIKSAYVENKELRDQLEFFSHKYAILESKLKNSDGLIKELKENVKECLEQIKIHDTLKLNSDKNISELEFKIKSLENEIKILKTDNIEKNSHYSKENNLNLKDVISKSYESLNKINANNALESDFVNRMFNNFNSIKLLKNDAFTIEKTGNKQIELNDSNHKQQKKADLPQNMSRCNKIIDSNKPCNKGTIKNELSENSKNATALMNAKDNLPNYKYNDIISEREISKKLINDYVKDGLNLKNSFKNNINNDISNTLENSNNDKYQDNNPFSTAIKEENKNELLSNNIVNKINKELSSLNCNYNYNDLNNDFLNKNNNDNNLGDFCNDNKLNCHNIKQNIKVKTNLKNNLGEMESINNRPPITELIINNDSNDKSENHNQSMKEINVPKRSANKKADKILEIVVKIKTVEDISSIVYHLFGEDILDQLISPDVDEELIEKVENTIEEIENLMQKDEYVDSLPNQESTKRELQKNQNSIIEEKEEESTFIHHTLNNKENAYNNVNISNNMNPSTSNGNDDKIISKNLNSLQNNKNNNSSHINNHYVKENVNFNAKNNLEGNSKLLASEKKSNSNKNIVSPIKFSNGDVYKNEDIHKKVEIDNMNFIQRTSGKKNNKSSIYSDSKKEEESTNVFTDDKKKLFYSNKAESQSTNYSGIGLRNKIKANSNNQLLNYQANDLEEEIEPNLNNKLYNENNENNNEFNTYDANYYQSKNYNKSNINSNDISKNSYDIISENNLRRSTSRFMTTNFSHNRSLSKPKKEIYSKDSAAASKINFEQSLRSYYDNRDNKDNNRTNSNSRLNTSGNMKRKVFNHYVKNNGDLFDPNIHRKYDQEYENRKSRSRGKNRINRGENSQNSMDIKSLKEMQRFKELYEKFKHLTINSENTNISSNQDYSGNNKSATNKGFIKRSAADHKNNKSLLNDFNIKPNPTKYLFNDEL